MKKRKYSKKYFIKPDKDEDVCVVNDIFFEDLGKTEAIVYCINSYLELQKTLKEDAICGNDAYIGNMKVTTGLERFLVKLDQKFPNIISEVKGYCLKSDGIKIFRC